MLELNGRKVLVLGLGDTGMSMARWLAARGARVTVADTREQPPHAAAPADARAHGVTGRGHTARIAAR